MQINITHLLATDLFPFAHSRAEGGQDAGRDTWNAALKGPRPLLNTPEEFEAFRDYAKRTGGWTEEEVSAWDENECQALFLQFIAGDVRQCPATLEEIEFEERWPGMWYFQTPMDKENDMEDGPYDSRSEAYRAASGELVGFNQTRRAESLDEIDWQEYEQDANEGRISSNLSRSDSGEVFYYLGM
jgi:Arc/MetJ-type ribon-helix-helix transcriptional regulator